MKNINLSKAIIPNSFTALSILSGFTSIVYSSQNEYIIASVLIMVAGVFDVLDGLLARMLKSSSQFGVELDSLADVLSFGAAPAFLIYHCYLVKYGWIGLLISACLLVFGAFRLARFNTQVEDITVKVDFKGLPIPISAIIIATFVIAFYKDGSILPQFEYFVIPLVFLNSALMVSSIRYNKMPKPSDFSLGEKIIYILVGIFAILIVYASDGKALFYIFLSMVLFGILRHIFYMIFSDKFNGNSKERTEEDNKK